jgi:hypothetical protein
MSQVGASYYQFLDEIGAALVVIAGSAGRYEQEARTFCAHQDVLEEITQYFAHIIRYLVRIEIHFSRKKLLQTFHGGLSAKLKGDYRDIREREARLDQRTRSTAHQSKECPLVNVCPCNLTRLCAG